MTVPRRWTVGTPALDFPPAYSPAVEKVRVREDRITDDDIERVAEWLNEYVFGPGSGEPTAVCEPEAREILALVLGVE